MSRSGAARNAKISAGFSNVEYVKGNCLHPDSFNDTVQDVDAVVHTVGALVPHWAPERDYKAMNRDSCINMARALNDTTSGANKNFVMISSAKAPPGLSEYITTKREAELYL